MKENGLWLAAACRDKGCVIWGVWYGNEILNKGIAASHHVSFKKQTNKNKLYLCKHSNVIFIEANLQQVFTIFFLYNLVREMEI